MIQDVRRKLVVFDFDKTLTQKDTLSGFYIHVHGYKPTLIPKYIIYTLYRVLFKLGLIRNYDLKIKGISLFLKGKSFEHIKSKSIEYANKIDLNDLYFDYDFKNNKHDIFVISASFEIYLSHLFPKNVKIIGSKLCFNDNKVYSLKFNCFSWDKVNVLNDLGINKIDILYTDSFSDFPLATIADEILIVDTNRLTKVSNIYEYSEYFKKKYLFNFLNTIKVSNFF